MNGLRRLYDLLAASEADLTARVIDYAKTRGYTPFTSTLEQAWRASIHGLSEPLLATLAEGRSISAVRAEPDYARDPIANYGIEAARRHRTRGITLGLFLGLMKSYRLSYLDLVADADADEAEKAEWSAVVANFFDRMEVGFCDEWAGKPADEQMNQLRATNRTVTNEKNKYLTIFESLNDPVFLVGETGGVENMNHAAARLFTTAEAPGIGYYGGERVDLADLIGFDPATCCNRVCERELATELGPRWFDIRTQRMLDVSEKYLGTVVILVDVTEYRKAKEDAETANRAKSTFLATMSHEIRTPIHGILGLADLLLRRGLDEPERGLVDAVARSGEMLSSVVSDILDYSKIEAGILDVETVEFSVASVIDDVVGLMRPIAARKPGLDLVVEMPTLPTVVGDPGKLRQILLNLVGNAVKFTPEGKVWLVVEEIAGPADRWELNFIVADTGIGIAPDRLAAIFEPFTQSDGSIARRYGGTGLGLAVCRRLVDRLGGHIGVDSSLGGGSRFRVDVPFARGSGRSPARLGGDVPPVPAAAPPSRPPVRPLDVLVVEDNDVNAIVARGLLERGGHRIRLAVTGRAAVEEVTEHRFDVVLMDLRLPDIDGIEATRRIRALADRERARVPIVALSAQVLRDDRRACIEAGMNDFLTKPFRAPRLEALLRRVAEGAYGTAAPAERVSLTGESPAPPETTPTPASAAAPNLAELVDASVLAGHAAVLGRGETARIVDAWKAGAADVPARLAAAAAAGDRRTVADLAHRLKGASAHVGLIHLSQAAGALERAMRETIDTSSPQPAVDAFLADLAAAAAALDRVCTDLGVSQPAKT